LELGGIVSGLIQPVDETSALSFSRYDADEACAVDVRRRAEIETRNVGLRGVFFIGVARLGCNFDIGISEKLTIQNETGLNALHEKVNILMTLNSPTRDCLYMLPRHDHNCPAYVLAPTRMIKKSLSSLNELKAA
jgi:hypothetical protein